MLSLLLFSMLDEAPFFATLSIKAPLFDYRGWILQIAISDTWKTIVHLQMERKSCPPGAWPGKHRSTRWNSNSSLP